MNIHQSYHNSPLDSKLCHVIKSRNDLEIHTMDYVGFENTVFKKEHSLLVLGKENDLEELVMETE